MEATIAHEEAKLPSDAVTYSVGNFLSLSKLILA
jgi:hypothetical protein